RTPTSPPFPYTTLFRSLVAQSVARIALAIKSAALPDVLSGKDLLQGNGLSQAGGGLAQVVGIGVGTVVAGQIAPWIGVLFGAARSEEHTSELQSLAYLV